MPTKKIEPRMDVVRFSKRMEKKLQQNDHKGGWKNEDPAWLFKRLKEEVKELKHAMKRRNIKAVHAEAADIANFAMMVADVFEMDTIPPRRAR